MKLFNIMNQSRPKGTWYLTGIPCKRRGVDVFQGLNFCFLAIIIWSAGCQPVVPQLGDEIKQSRNVGDTLIVFGVSALDPNDKFSFEDLDISRKSTIVKDSRKVFYSFKFGKIQQTQGTYSGKPLHGEYEVFYKKRLIEKGNFSKGLKDGKWHQWTEDGSLKSIYYYKEGLKHGNYAIYQPAGQLNESGKYKNGGKHGKVTILTDEEKLLLRFRDNALVDTLTADRNKLPFLRRKKPGENESTN